MPARNLVTGFERSGAAAMSGDDNEEDFVFYGTPLQREEDVGPSKRKQALEQGRLRSSSSWQEVFDENGRRRFHGAFTGGYSAGYYNTVGSKEGWTPQAFTSSRKKRAEMVQQKTYDFMDEDEKAEQDSASLGAASEFDTFGFTAAESARQEVAVEMKKRPSAIPGLPPEEIIVPLSNSIGQQLLVKMGWRYGRAIGPKHISASSEARRQGRKAMLALAQNDESKASVQEEDPLEEQHDGSDSKETQATDLGRSTTPTYLLNPKKDRYGLGFDPYKNAPEFRERKEAQLSEGRSEKTKSVARSSLFRPNIGRMGSGFGIGALEELDEDDEDIYNPGVDMDIVPSDEEEEHPTPKKQRQEGFKTKPGVLPGFKPASISEYKADRFAPPIVPPDFVALHKFSDSLDSERGLLCPEPPNAAPPEDVALRRMIEGIATLIARSGPMLENLIKEKRAEDSKFEFLFGSNGYGYYRRKLWEEQRKVAKDGKEQLFLPQNATKKEATLDSVQRGEILGEIPLERKSKPVALPTINPEDRSRLQAALSDSFIKYGSQIKETSQLKFQPFEDNPSKRARFEQFLKDRFQGGLRAVQSGVGSLSTELERAQETLEFEAACHGLQKSEVSASILNASVGGGRSLQDLQDLINDRFAPSAQSFNKEPNQSQEQEQAAVKYPRREETSWRPFPLLCKRFNLPDPYLGKPPPLPKPKSRIENFILISNPPTASLETPLSAMNWQNSTPTNQDSTLFSDDLSDTKQAPVEIILEKPVDLYKAIFSDDSDEEEVESLKEAKTEDKTTQAAQAALNRLEAGDFLASIGKELGLRVPPSVPSHSGRAKDLLGGPPRSTNALDQTTDVSDNPRSTSTMTFIHADFSEVKVDDLPMIEESAMSLPQSQGSFGKMRDRTIEEHVLEKQKFYVEGSSEDYSNALEKKRQAHRKTKGDERDLKRHKREGTHQREDKEKDSRRHRSSHKHHHHHHKSRKHHKD